nr:hypothetical protein [Lysinibacillus timonensis]
MKLVNMIKERGYIKKIEQSIHKAAPYLLSEKNSKSILQEMQRQSIIGPETYQFFETKLETAKIILKTERFVKESFGLNVQGMLFLFDRNVKAPGNFGTLYYITAPNMNDEIIQAFNEFDVGPSSYVANQIILNKQIVQGSVKDLQIETSHQNTMEKYGFKDYFVVPIVLNGVTVAAIALFSPNKIPKLTKKMKTRIFNYLHLMENAIDHLQYQWQSLRKIRWSCIISNDGFLSYIDSAFEYALGEDVCYINSQKSIPHDYFTHPEDKEGQRECFKKSVCEKIPQTFVGRGIYDVGIIVVEVHFKPILNDDGSVRYVLGEGFTNTILCKQFEREVKLKSLKMIKG